MSKFEITPEHNETHILMTLWPDSGSLKELRHWLDCVLFSSGIGAARIESLKVSMSADLGRRVILKASCMNACDAEVLQQACWNAARAWASFNGMEVNE